MNTKKFVLMWLTYVVVTFPLAVIWHLLLFKGLYDQLGIYNRQEPIFALGVAAIVIQGGMLAYVYPLLRRDGSALASGLRFGALIGLYNLTYAVLAAGAKHEVSSLAIWLLLGGAFCMVHLLTAGTAMALVYGNKPAAPAS